MSGGLDILKNRCILHIYGTKAVFWTKEPYRTRYIRLAKGTEAVFWTEVSYPTCKKEWSRRLDKRVISDLQTGLESSSGQKGHIRLAKGIEAVFSTKGNEAVFCTKGSYRICKREWSRLLHIRDWSRLLGKRSSILERVKFGTIDWIMRIIIIGWAK